MNKKLNQYEKDGKRILEDKEFIWFNIGNSNMKLFQWLLVGLINY